MNLEWEVSAKAAKELADEFKNLASYFPPEGTAPTILSMNRRTLQRAALPGASPHPTLIKMLQESVSILRMLHSSPGNPPPAAETAFSALVRSYKEIMKVPLDQGPSAAHSEPEPEKEGGPNYVNLVNKMGTAIHDLAEVSRRLARILGVMRQGGEMSGEEITRRLGTLELLLSDRVGQLASSQKELAGLGGPGGGIDGDPALQRQAARAPDGLVLTIWQRFPLAIPSSAIAGLYPLTREQAEKFRDKDVITLGNKPIKRLPLKAPAGAGGQAKPPPAWLVHLSVSGKDFFLLAEKSAGFRRTPTGLDVFRDTKVKIGGAVYAVLNMAAFR